MQVRYAFETAADGTFVPNLLGESLNVFPEDASAFWWVDIKAAKIFRALLPELKVHCWHVPVFLTALASVRVSFDGSHFVIYAVGGLGEQAGLYALTVEVGEDQHSPLTWTKLSAPEEVAITERFNDGVIGPDGRFYCGTMDDCEMVTLGRLWSVSLSDGFDWCQIDPERNDLVTKLYRVPNGPVFEGHRMYHNDSAKRRMYCLNWCDAREAWGERYLFWQFSPNDGYPDGMAIGPDGKLYVAMWGSARIERFDLNKGGKRLDPLDVPVKYPTKPCFIKAHDGKLRLFVTSATIAEPGNAGRHDGGIVEVAYK